MSIPFSIAFIARTAFLILLLAGAGNARLTQSFYNTRCPQFGTIVRDAVRLAVSRDPRMGASLLRLHFHDCFVNGCDASVLLDDTATVTGEKTAPPNMNSLRGFEVIDDIKAQLERVCPGVVSCADITAVAARDGVVAVNGPSWSVALGRRDSTTSSYSGAETELPGPFSDIETLISGFSRKGFSPREMVALSGAHSIGQARCFLFRDRIYNEVNTTNPAFAASMQANCPRTGGDDNLAPLDATPNSFDNRYYRDLQGQRGLLHSDQALTTRAGTASQVNGYAANSASFFNDFAAAMVKMSNLSPLTGTQGQIRANCRRVN